MLILYFILLSEGRWIELPTIVLKGNSFYYDDFFITYSKVVPYNDTIGFYATIVNNEVISNSFMSYSEIHIFTS